VSNTTRLVAVGDAVAIGAATYLGFVFHGEPAAWDRFALTASAFWVAWMAAAAPLGLYRADALSSPSTGFRRTWAAWVFAAPLGATVRAFLLGAPTVPVVFVVVTALVDGGATAVWRAASAWWIRRRT
jgi:hypothetical protein